MGRAHADIAIVAGADNDLLSTSRDVYGVDDLLMTLVTSYALPGLCVPACYRSICRG